MRSKKRNRWILIPTAVAILLLTYGTVASQQKNDADVGLPQPAIPTPQFFCGYCHILTYPSIVMEGYETWKTDKHNKYGCVECHYPPGETGRGVETKKTPHIIPKRAPERFSYLPLGGDTVLTRPKILDANCMTSKCHGSPEDKFKTKKIKFTEKVPFIHEKHFEKKNQIEGMQINCTSCHQHETDKRHFQVEKATCHLCHFENTKFNEGRGKCKLCHELPKKPIQTSGEKPITHEMLEKANVTCGSCHYDLIQAAGGSRYEAFFDGNELKTTLVLGAGRVKDENCLACQDQPKDLKEVGNKKLMHEKHVTIKNSRCFDCHRPIGHTKADLNEPKQPPFIQDRCAICHPEPHNYQRLLIAGEKREGVTKSPDPMLKARTNCLGCHVEMGVGSKGNPVMKASGKTCVACHTKEHDKMLQDWKTELTKELEAAMELKEEAQEALSQSKLPASELAEVKEWFENGRENLTLVLYGNGVHNKKYAMLLIDAAMGNFEDLLDELDELEGNGG